MRARHASFPSRTRHCARSIGQLHLDIFYDNADCSGGGEQISIGNTTAVTLNHNELATSEPGFVDLAGRDLRLLDTSAMVDAALFAAHAVGSGSGTSLTVDDAGYFYDGYGLAGEQGDVIQIEGQTDTARVVAIDYAAATLSLDASLSLQDGDGVHLAYAGTAPDMGALELGQNIGGGGSGAGGGNSGTGGSGAAAGAGARGSQRRRAGFLPW